MLQDADLLEGLHDLAVNGARGIDVLGGARATVLGSAVDLAETANADGLAGVDEAGDGGSADVVPVRVLRRHLLGGTGLDGINPTCQAQNTCQQISTIRQGTTISRALPGMGSLPWRFRKAAYALMNLCA